MGAFTGFAVALLAAMAGLEGQKPANTTLVSPLSAAAALTLALNAAGVPSATHTELLRALSQNATASGGAAEKALNGELSRLMATLPSDAADERALLANALWAREGVGLKEAYVKSMQELFQATAKSGATPDDINAWVKDATQGLIPSLVSPDAAFDVVLTNALYFKGKWSSQFQVQDTQARQFTTHTGAKRQVQMMQRRYEAGEMLYAAAPGKFRAVRLPYRGGNFSAIAVLPDNYSTKPESLLPMLASGWSGSGGGLFAPLPKGSLAAAGGNGSGSGPWQAKRRAVVALPRFKLRASMSLSQPLSKMGVSAAFAPSAADFSRAEADPSSPFYVSDVVQEVYLNVDEQGTEAAAATAVVMLTSAADLDVEVEEVVFDRPFLFGLVHDASGELLVLGVIRDPPAGAERPPPPPGSVARQFGGAGRRLLRRLLLR